MKKRDFITIISIISLVALCFFITIFNKGEKGQFVKVIKDNTLVGTYPISDDYILDLGTNKVVISDNTVYMKDCSCPDLLCQKQKAISYCGEHIVCLPNKIVVSIEKGNSPISRDSLYFNTYINVTIYDSTDEQLLDEVMDICSKYEKICSRTNSDSELYKLNHRLTSTIESNNIYPHYEVSSELFDMIKQGLYYTDISDHNFNIAIAAVTDLWDFSGGSNVIPKKEEIDSALPFTNPEDIILNEDGTISFKSKNVMIDLGGMAKGYIADRIKEYLLSQNVHSATISLGGNILCVGSKLGIPFKIGIKKPFDNNGATVTEVSVDDKSVVTSGIYERYFEIDGTVYHHILDSKNGYPIQNDIQSISVISDSSVDGDCLSTWLFSLGVDGALEYAYNNPDINVIIIDSNNNIISSK